MFSISSASASATPGIGMLSLMIGRSDWRLFGRTHVSLESPPYRHALLLYALTKRSTGSRKLMSTFSAAFSTDFLTG